MRRLVAETSLVSADLVQPLFVAEGIAEPTPIASMPGVVRHTLDSLPAAINEAAAAGVGGVMLFGVPQQRDATGSAAVDPEGILNRAIAVAVAAAGERLSVMADVCLDEFTDHGACGLLTADGAIDNDATVARYAEIAVAQARAGADILGFSGMMDGQVAGVRTALDDSGFIDTAVLAYTAKYASAWFGPFRDATGTPRGV
ncbi:MAG: porphobilinogen synthase, partial [Actinomycetia bacterium]|nr:porphobilinogen synthase [Actinomycetes bacterium]